MRVLIVLENYWPHIGGVETLFKNVAEGLVKNGHNVNVVTHRLKGTPTYEEKNGVKIHRVRCFDSRYLFTFFAVPKVLKLAKKADIIHTTTFNGAGPAWLASKLRKKPCIITIHEVWIGKWKELTDFSWLNSKIHDLLERPIFMLNYDKYVTVSKSTKNQLLDLGIPGEKIKVVYNGLDYSHFDPKKYDGKNVRKKLDLDGNFVCLSFGRLGPSKGIKYAVKSVPKIAKKIPNFKYVLILSKDKQYMEETNRLKHMIGKSKYKDNFLILDPVPYKELPAYIKASDCVIVPSLAEGFGYTVAESCAMSVPVVASNTTSIPEVISGKYILFPSKDSKAIAKAVENVYKKKVKTKSLKRFTWEKTVSGYLGVYRKCYHESFDCCGWKGEQD